VFGFSPLHLTPMLLRLTLEVVQSMGTGQTNLQMMLCYSIFRKSIVAKSGFVDDGTEKYTYTLECSYGKWNR
jgi:hypothetical protein